MSSNVLGLIWILIAGLTQGAFPLPMKFVRKWKWEHLWLVYSVIAFLLLPWITAWATVPHLTAVYAAAPRHVIWLIAFYGAGWGAGSVFFGLGVDALGLGVGLLHDDRHLYRPRCPGSHAGAHAGPDLDKERRADPRGERDHDRGSHPASHSGRYPRQAGWTNRSAHLNRKISFSTGLIIALLSGVLSGMLNFCYAFGKPLADAAQQFGATKQNSLNAMWLVALPAGGILNIGYCAYLMFQRKSWKLLYRGTLPMDWIHAWVMSILWTGSVIVYGWGADRLGRLGPSLGWSLWNAILIITTVVCGFLTHEWDGVKGRALKLLLAGIALLILATVVLGLGGAGT